MMDIWNLQILKISEPIFMIFEYYFTNGANFFIYTYHNNVIICFQLNVEILSENMPMSSKK